MAAIDVPDEHAKRTGSMLIETIAIAACGWVEWYEENVL
jgi:hypothetical protein